MRAFLGILQTDGSTPDERLVRELIAAPEHQLDRYCAFAGAPLLTARNGALWLIGELRLDDKATLAQKLGTRTDDDHELALLAWERWGASCVEHLFGDFSFAVWDGAAGELFCARDRFGVRPFFYARTAHAVVFSNSIEAVLAHPGVDASTLDDGAVSDYITSGVGEDGAATIYASVRRLPPAHLFAHLAVRRYWSLQQPQKRDGRPEALERALKDAVADRLTAGSAMVFMSGGLDSTTLAALAREVKPEVRLLAGTSVYRRRIPDVEEKFAAEAARAIGIDIRFFVLDDFAPLASVDKGLWTAEPGPLLTAAMTYDVYAICAAHAPVAMHGHPADAVLHGELTPYLRSLNPLQLVAALLRYTMMKRRPPYFFARDLLGLRRRRAPPYVPDWLRTPFVREWNESALAHPMWSNWFEWAHPLQTRAAIELVYPWSDLRVIEAAQSLAPIPWLINKHVVRELLRHRISEPIRTRRKTFVQGDPWVMPLRREISMEAAARYIDPRRFAAECSLSGALSDTTLRAAAFAWWVAELPRQIGRLRLNRA